MVRINPASRITTPLPARSVPSTDAENASSGISERSETTASSTGPRSKRKPLAGGCSSAGKAQSVDSAMDAALGWLEKRRQSLARLHVGQECPAPAHIFYIFARNFFKENRRSPVAARQRLVDGSAFG